jgi:hypothetical protein
MHGYGSTAILGNPSDGKVAQVWHGGSHPYPHAVLTGEWAQPGAELIRASFPQHTVSRVDVREDFDGASTYDSIQAMLLEVAERHGIKVDCKGDHLLTKTARTVYLGAPTSSVRMRLYDKRAEVLSKFASATDRFLVARAMQLPEHLSRLESQIRPHTREARELFATIEPIDALGCNRWTREAWRNVAGLDLAPVQVGRAWRQTDDERAYRYLLSQYGGLLRRMREDAGSWECLGLQLGQDLARPSA